MGPVGACPLTADTAAKRANKRSKVNLRVMAASALVYPIRRRCAVRRCRNWQQFLEWRFGILGEIEHVPRTRQAQAPARTASSTSSPAIPGERRGAAAAHPGGILAPPGAIKE